MELESSARPRDSRGRHVVVTGGSRGIGLMIAEAFAEAGDRVVISSRKAPACEEAAAEIRRGGGNCVAVPADLGAEAGVAALASVLGDEPVDVLVNNAGAAWGAPLDEYPPEAFDKVWSINVKGVFAVTQRLLPNLRAAAGEESPARVINIGSIDGLRVPFFDNFAYSASKAGVHMLTQHMAVSLAPDHITVNAIAPGPFRSKMMAAAFAEDDDTGSLTARIPLGRAGEPRDIAGLTKFLAGSNATWITGAVIPLDGGLSVQP